MDLLMDVDAPRGEGLQGIKCTKRLKKLPGEMLHFFVLQYSSMFLAIKNYQYLYSIFH